MTTKNWFARREITPIGPFTQEDIQKRILAGEISPEDLLWKDGENSWRPAVEWAEFKRLSIPAFQMIAGFRPQDEIWIVLKRTLQGYRTLGPWSQERVMEKMKSNEINGNDHIWTKGMTGWARLSSRPDFTVSDWNSSSTLLKDKTYDSTPEK